MRGIPVVEGQIPTLSRPQNSNTVGQNCFSTIDGHDCIFVVGNRKKLPIFYGLAPYANVSFLIDSPD
jgi:hypothetical protein